MNSEELITLLESEREDLIMTFASTFEDEYLVHYSARVYEISRILNLLKDKTSQE